MIRKLALGMWMIVTATFPVHAQEQVQQGEAVTASGEAYLKALRFRGVDTDVIYYDPSQPAPEFDTRETPDPAREPVDVDLDRDQASFLANALAVAVLLGVAFLFLRFGGRFSVSLRGEDDASRSVGAGAPGPAEMLAKPVDLDAIDRIEDRRLALVTLAQSALLNAITQNGLFLQKSWTARDALRRLPKDMRHHDALRDLVVAGERVLFGGRDVPEADFQDHVARIRPLFTAGLS